MPSRHAAESGIADATLRQSVDVRRVRLLFLLACAVFVSFGLVAAWFAPVDPESDLTGPQRYMAFLGSLPGLLALGAVAVFILFGIWYLRFLASPPEPVAAIDDKLRQDGRLLKLVLVALVLSLGSVGFLFINDTRSLFREEKQRELSAIVRAKAQQVDWWIMQHTRDAQALAGAIRSLPFDPLAIEGESRQIVDVLLGAVLAGTTDRTGVSLVRPDGKLLISLGEDGVPDADTMAALTSVPASPPGFRIVDVHEVAGPKPLLRMSFIVPLEPGSGSDLPTLLVLVLTVDPMRDIFTRVVTWPADGPSPEIVLVHRDRDDIVYLTPPNASDGGRVPALYRMPLARASLPEAQAILHGDAVREGVNSRGKSVLSASHHVTVVPWFVVATADRGTIMAPIQEKTFALGLTTVAIILIAVFMVLLLWQGQRASYLSFRELQAEERAAVVAQLEERVRLAGALRARGGETIAD